MKKRQEKPKAKCASSASGEAKMSKLALWWQKNPNGIGIIHDMRAVMR
jgi:hypothetical protein